MIYRGKVTKANASKAWVRIPDLHPTDSFECAYQGGRPSVGASVLVANASDSEVSPDMTVVGTGGVQADGSLVVGGLRIRDSGAGFILFENPGNNLRLYGGSTVLQINYSGAVEISRQTVKTDDEYTLVTKGYVDALKTNLKTIAAASTSFADFQSRIAAW